MKIFGIGLSKTGTTSLAQALEILGYRVKDYPGIERYRAGDVTSIDRTVIDGHDALTDTPIPSFFRELDQAYPGSKFILTIRDTDSWLRSCKKQFTPALAAKQNEAHRKLFLDLYGTDVYDETKFLQGYRRHIDQVLEYFKDRPADLLVLDLTAGDGWHKLCAFLGKPVPDRPFPKANVTAITWTRIEQIVEIAASAGEAALYHMGIRSRTNPLSAMWSAWRSYRGVGPWQAWHTATRHIESALNAMNADIPIVIRGKDTPPFAVRRKWNHYWLVDPLGCAPWLAADGHEICQHIALVQDGAPFMTVTSHPHSKLVFYGRRDKGVYLQMPGEDKEILPGRNDVQGLRSDNPNLAACIAIVNGRLPWHCNENMHKAQLTTAALFAHRLDCFLTEGATGEVIRFDTPDIMVSGLKVSHTTT